MNVLGVSFIWLGIISSMRTYISYNSVSFHAIKAFFRSVSFVPYSELTASGYFKIILLLNGPRQTCPRLCRLFGQYNTLAKERIAGMSTK